MQAYPLARTCNRTLVDAHIVLSLGAIVNYEYKKHRVSVVYRTGGEARILYIKDSQFKCEKPPEICFLRVSSKQTRLWGIKGRVVVTELHRNSPLLYCLH